MELIINFAVLDYLHEQNGQEVTFTDNTTQVHINFGCGCKVVHDFIRAPSTAKTKFKEFILPCSKHKPILSSLNK
jgi:hypothetical protein